VQSGVLKASASDGFNAESRAREKPSDSHVSMSRYATLSSQKLEGGLCSPISVPTSSTTIDSVLTFVTVGFLFNYCVVGTDFCAL
jgi:hypothetical protein